MFYYENHTIYANPRGQDLEFLDVKRYGACV